MRTTTKVGTTSSIPAAISTADSGGFTAIASTPDLDRDGEVLLPGCFSPLPESVPVHLDHSMSAATLVARARPYYDGDRLMVEAVFSSTPAAQEVRQKVLDGTLTDLSVVFLGKDWKDVAGVRSLVSGELLAADLVSVPSNRSARILTTRNYDPSRASGDLVRHEVADALVALARGQIAEAKRVLAEADQRGRTLTPGQSATSFVQHLLEENR